jgi:putative molybdopterin biosynthesis protein
MPGRFRTSLRARRHSAGLQQQELAERVGVSRQTISAIETGEAVPSTEIALDLARVLGCKVEELFTVFDGGAAMAAQVVGFQQPWARATGRSRSGAGPVSPGKGTLRVALGLVGEHWIAHPMAACSRRPAAAAADGLVSLTARAGTPERTRMARVRPLRDGPSLRRNVFIAGCDPAIGLLGDHLIELGRGPHVRWLPLGSGDALSALAGGQVHIAGLHLSSEDDHQANGAEVRRRLAGRPMAMVNLASWEQGLVCAARNPRALRSVADLGRRGIRVVLREPGAGAQRLLERHLARARLALSELAAVSTVGGHLEVAQSVAFGLADAGVATREAAEAFGLFFAPLEEARFDLTIPEDLLAAPLMEPLLETLAGAAFRRELHALSGYQTRRTGEVVARVGT